jgi:hypothetical protein
VLLWPFVALWRLLAWIVVLTGRLVGVIVGAALILVGIVLTLTVVGAILGIPLIILGFLLMVRGLF